MYEYHCWAMLPDFGDREAEHRLRDELDARIAQLDDGSRDSFHVTNLNALVVTASGLRNHAQGLLIGVFEWIATAWPGSYGLMHIRPEHPDADGQWRFHVLRMANGGIEHLEDRYLTDVA